MKGGKLGVFMLDSKAEECCSKMAQKLGQLIYASAKCVTHIGYGHIVVKC